MQLEYDPQADALYISLQKKYVSRTREVEPGVSIDLDNKGRVIGFEVLDVSKKVRHPELMQFSVKNLAAVQRGAM